VWRVLSAASAAGISFPLHFLAGHWSFLEGNRFAYRSRGLPRTFVHTISFFHSHFTVMSVRQIALFFAPPTLRSCLRTFVQRCFHPPFLQFSAKLVRPKSPKVLLEHVRSFSSPIPPLRRRFQNAGPLIPLESHRWYFLKEMFIPTPLILKFLDGNFLVVEGPDRVLKVGGLSLRFDP